MSAKMKDKAEILPKITLNDRVMIVADGETKSCYPHGLPIGHIGLLLAGPDTDGDYKVSGIGSCLNPWVDPSFFVSLGSGLSKP